MKNFIVSLLLSLTVTACSYTHTVPTAKNHRELQFENDKVRVWKTTLAPSNNLKMHRHESDRVIVGLKGGTLEKIEHTGERSDLVFEAGRAYWFEKDKPGTQHADINHGPGDVQVMVIEVK